jgi:cytochrome P450
VTSEAIIDLTIHADRFTADPYSVYRRLRALGPVHRVRTAELGESWMVVGYDEARAALTDRRLGKDWRILHPGADYPAGGVDGHLLETDPPAHTRLRRLVAREFTARRMEALRPRIRQITTELLDAVLPLGAADLVEALAFPLPITVICELLGVPDLDREEFRGWTHAIIDGSAGEVAAVAEMSGYLAGLIERKRRPESSDDLLGALVRARDDDGERLSGQEAVAMAFLLLVAGHETTVNLIGNGTLALLRHPAQLAALRADPGLLDGAIEEMLRYDGPVRNATYRFTREAVDIGGYRIPAQQAVVVALASGDRDDSRYPAPDTFDIRRAPQGHLAFGHGIHYCVGAPLARIEAQVAFTELLARAPELALVEEPLAWRPSALMRGVRRLPVTF